MLLLIIAAVGTVIIIVNSYTYQLGRADQFFAEGKYSKAIEFYLKALEKGDSSASEMKLASDFISDVQMFIYVILKKGFGLQIY